MKIILLEKIEKLFAWIEGQSQKRIFLPVLILFLTSMTLFWATPKYIYFFNNLKDWKSISDAYVFKSQHLTSSLTHIEPSRHEAKFVFRLTIPLFMRLTGLDPYQLYPFKFIIAVLTLLMCWLLTYRILDDRVSAALVASGMTFVYFGRSGFVIQLFFDSIPYFFALCALYSRRMIPIFAYCFVCALTDERAFLSLPMIILFHQLYGRGADTTDSHLPRLLLPTRTSMGVILAMAVYITLRLSLTCIYGMHTPSAGVGLREIRQNGIDIPIGIWTFLEGFWFVVLLSFAVMLNQRRYFLLILSLMQFLVLTIGAIAVNDVTRSGAYLTPFVFISILLLREHLTQFQMRTLLLAAAVVSFAFPAFYVLAGTHMQYPIILEFFRSSHY